MNEKTDPKLIRNYTKGHYSFLDLKKIAVWFKDAGSQDELKSVIEAHWSEFEIIGAAGRVKDLSSVYNNIRNHIFTGKNKESIVYRIFHVYSKIAAVLLLPFIIYSAFSIFNKEHVPFVNSWVEVVSPKGTRTHFYLPDGTKVSLNSGTHLSYNADFRYNREVKISGEAYFDVFHDAASPFVVRTDILDVTVLGTKFSIASLDTENSVEVILEEGKVQLAGNSNSFDEMLRPNEGFYYDKKSRSGKILAVDAPYLTAWKDGLLIFRNEPLREVLKRIGRWYNVRFDIQDQQVENFRYRATFHEEPLAEVLRLIALTAPIEYEIKERNMNQNGIYNEEVVIIKTKKLE